MRDMAHEKMWGKDVEYMKNGRSKDVKHMKRTRRHARKEDTWIWGDVRA